MVWLGFSHCIFLHLLLSVANIFAFSKQNIILDNFLCCLVFMDGRVGN